MRNSVYPHYAEMEEKHWWFLGRLEIIRGIAAHVLPPAPSAHVVEVGCATGGVVGRIADLAHVRTGIDPSMAAISIAESRYPDVKFICGHAPGDVQPEISSADLIMICDVLEHVRESKELLGDLIGAMKGGANLLITVPADPALWSPHDDAVSHVRRYRPTELEAEWKFQAQSVKVRLFSFFNARLYPIVRIGRFLSRRRGYASGFDGTDLSVPPRLINLILKGLFSGEKHRLLEAIDGEHMPFKRGVSLIALLERE